MSDLQDLLKKDSDSSDGNEPISNENFTIFSKPAKAPVEYDVYLSESVESAFNYVSLCHKLRNLEEQDSVRIYLANYGGDAHGGSALVSAISDTKALVTMIVTAPVWSMGAILAVSGDNLLIKAPAFLMFHNYTTGLLGKGAAIKADLANTDRWLAQLDKIVVGKFLFKEEHEAIKRDQDVYVHWDDPRMLERYAKKWPKHYGRLFKQALKG